MPLHLRLFAAVLAVAAACVVVGVTRINVEAGWITAGLLLAGWGWLTLTETSPSR